MIVAASLLLGGLVALAWTVLAIRLIVLSRGPWFRFLNPIDPTTSIRANETVEAIVPARNEAERVEATIVALRGQNYPHLAITAVDDQSTDSTLTILGGMAACPGPDGQASLQVVAGRTRPPGWVGKTWAVHQAAQVATAEWLWFVDADMGLDPNALRTALAEADRVGADLVSLLPGVRCDSFWQRTIASSFLHILAHLYPLNRVNDPKSPEAIAAGGFLLIRRSVYQRVGGHEAIRNAIVEDIALARNVKRAGGRLVVRLAPHVAWTHMYGSFGDIWVGLRKNAYAGMDFLPHKLVVGNLVALCLAWAPILAIVVGASAGSRWAVGIGCWGVLAQVCATIPHLIFIKSLFLYAFALPLGISAYVAIAIASAWGYHRGAVVWKGRAIDSETIAGSVLAQGDKFQGQA